MEKFEISLHLSSTEIWNLSTWQIFSPRAWPVGPWQIWGMGANNSGSSRLRGSLAIPAALPDADFTTLENMMLHRAQHKVPGGSELHLRCNSLVEKAPMLARVAASCELRRSPRASASVAIWAICPMPAFGHYHAAQRNMPSIWDLLCSISARRD